MKRKQFLESVLMTLGALSVSRLSSGFSYQSESYEIKMLTKDFGIFSERGGTIGFHLSKDGITVVDAQFPDTAAHLISELKKKNMPFRLLINTHHHYDHTAGNIAFKSLTPRLVAHENSLKNQRRVAEQQNPAELQYFPNETFSEGWSEQAGGETISMYYFGPAHTDGDAIIHFEGNGVAHVGDLVFNRRYPYIDQSAGASIQNWIKVLQKTQDHFSGDTIFVCGHAGAGFPVTGGKKMLSDFEGYLSASLNLVSSLIQSGKSEKEIMTVTSIPGFTDWQGDGIERTLKAAYLELTGGNAKK